MHAVCASQSDKHIFCSHGTTTNNLKNTSTHDDDKKQLLCFTFIPAESQNHFTIQRVKADFSGQAHTSVRQRYRNIPAGQLVISCSSGSHTDCANTYCTPLTCLLWELLLCLNT